MSALYDVDNVSLDLAGPAAGLQRLLPGTAPRMTILSNLTLTVGHGEMLGLVGESGSGKSTLARAMMGLIAVTDGRLSFEGRLVRSRADFVKVRKAAALMFQDAVASLSPRRKVAAQLIEPFEINGAPLPDGDRTAEMMLERVGLPPELARRYPHELSGGQARRVSVARALALKPKLVIADEPTAGLDVSVQAEILNLMTGLRRDMGLSFLIITHNLAVVRHVTDRVAVLYLGRMAEWGPTREVFARPYHPYTRSLVAAEPQADPRKRRADIALKGEVPSVLARPTGCEFHTRCSLARPRCAVDEPKPNMIAPGRMVRCHFAEETRYKLKEESMGLTWSTDRRSLLKAGGALFAGLAARPHFAWAADGDTLRLRATADFQVLDPKGIIGELDDIIPRCTQVTLVRLGDMRDGNKITPYAAKTFEWKDPKTIAFTLHDNLTWNNGFGPVTAEDVKFSFERIKGSDSAWAYQFEKLDNVEVIDQRSGLIHLKEPFKPFVYISLPYYGGHIVCKAAVEKAGGSYTTEIPAQCGPYLLDKWEQNQKVTLVANPDWKGEKPAFSKVEYFIVTDDQTALLAYEADSFDYTRVAMSAAKALKASLPKNSSLIEAQSTRYVWLTINMNAEKLKDPRVRQAIQYAYDGDAVLQGSYDGLTGRSAGVVQPGTQFAREKNKIATRDIEKAKALLAEAGVSAVELNLYCLTDSVSQSTAQIIQASLGEAGITVNIQPTEDAAYWALGDKTQGDGYKNIELVLMNFAGGIDPTENLVWFRPDQIGVYNWSFFDSKEFEDLYQKGLVEQDDAKRKEIFNKMEDLMEDSGGFIFVCFEPFLAIYRSDIKPVILADGHPDPTQFTKA